MTMTIPLSSVNVIEWALFHSYDELKEGNLMQQTMNDQKLIGPRSLLFLSNLKDS
jgi:hypothetical protein